MNLNDNSAYSLNVKRMRNDLIKGIMKDEEYKKKDDKKKEIVKSCKSYKDFCNIVESVNMKPIRKYEEKVTYEDFVNSNYFSSNSKSLIYKENNRKNNLYLMINKFINNNKEKYDSFNDKDIKESNATEQLLNVIKMNKENFYEFIKSNYNCDDVKNVIYLIKCKRNILFEIDGEPNEENGIDHDNNQKEKYHVDLFDLINFLFYLSKHWKDRNLSMFFTRGELNDINLDIYAIIEKIKKKGIENEDVIGKLGYIKSTFLV